MIEDKLSKAISKTVHAIPAPAESDYVGLKVMVRKACDYFQIAMFPSFAGQELDICKACTNSQKCTDKESDERRTIALNSAADFLIKALCKIMGYNEAVGKTVSLIDKIPEIHATLETDVQAGFEGDPAACSRDEVILSYPAFPAICVYRIAHELYRDNVRIIPRIMTEYAHEITGIDIHPGATIGPYFFIDHGTGVVIGETTVIGSHVKLYQHVTLGAKSFEANPDGSLVKGIKRHPNIGNNVVIYAGATILGGDTLIGDNCIVGGNVWLIHSLEPGQIITRSSDSVKVIEKRSEDCRNGKTGL